MKRIVRILSLCIAVLVSITMFAACGSSKEPAETTAAAVETQGETTAQPVENKDVTLTYLVCWNGGGSTAPTDLTGNTVAKLIKEKTGVTLDMQYITTPENERLNLIFASGDLPDMINAPFWGGADACTISLKNAAKQGLLLQVDDLIESLGANVKLALTEGVAKDFRENDLEDPEFGGKHYFIPQQTPKSTEDYTNWGVANYVRKDILEVLNIKPEDLKTSEDLYELLKKIKAGNFKDINGKPVIPAGTWASGWSYAPLTNSFSDNNLAGFSKVDEKWRLAVFSPNIDKQVLFMRKLVAEGLFDKEAFTQNDTIATQKMATGKVALTGAHYFYMKDKLAQTLYKTNPEMQYVSVCVQDANGENVQIAHKVMNGRAGSPVIVLSKSNKDPEASMKLLNFMNSEEGKLAAYYGIEGTHFAMEDGKPRLTADWLEKYKADPKNLQNEGIQSTYTGLVLQDEKMSKYGEITPGTAANKDELYENVKAMAPLKLVDGYRMSYFKSQYPKAADIDVLTAWNTYNDALTKSYFAKTDEDALNVLNGYREQLVKGGIEEYENFINEKAATRNDILN